MELDELDELKGPAVLDEYVGGTNAVQDAPTSIDNTHKNESSFFINNSYLQVCTFFVEYILSQHILYHVCAYLSRAYVLEYAVVRFGF